MTTATDSTSMRTSGIRQRRESVGVSRLELAIRSKCSVTSLAQIEAGLLPHRGEVLPRVVAALERLEDG